MIYVKDGDKSKSVKDLLESNFTHYEYDVYKFRSTYTDRELKNLQCKAARRSFPDLFELVKTYFPSTTKRKLAYILLNKIENMRSFLCPAIKTIVFVVDKDNKISGSKFYRDKENIPDCNGLTFEVIKKLAEKFKK